MEGEMGMDICEVGFGGCDIVGGQGKEGMV